MATAYKIQVRPQHERQKLIADRAATGKTVESWDIYESKPEPLAVITLPIDVPIYRMENGRTQTEQMAYIADASLSEDFFSAHEGDVSAQAAQHKILDRFARDGTDSITPIIKELERTGQTEPILITPTGVVVNGNRRLAAMRELLEKGHQNFASVQCAVLPVLTPEQIDDVEDRLQMRPETKLPYTWTNDALRVRKRLAAKQGKDEAVAHVMRRQKADIQKAISALNYADIYLKDWRKRPYDYELVKDGRQFFYDLPARLKGKEGVLLEANMRMAWILFDSRGNLGSRIYDFNRVIGEKAPEVLEKLAERIEVNGGADLEPEEAATQPKPGVAEELEIDFGDAPPAPQYEELIAVLDDESRRDEVVEELKQVCQTIIDVGKAVQLGNSALSAVRDANTRLTEVDLSKADPKTYNSIEKQLGEVLHRAETLRDKLKDIAAAKAAGDAA